MPANTYSIELSIDEKDYLKSIIKAKTMQAQVVDRARKLLWKSEARPDKTITDNLGVSINTVRQCIERYNTIGLNLALFDDERSGRPIEIIDNAKTWIVSITRQKPCDLVYTAKLWERSTLHKHRNTQKKQAILA